MLKMTPLYAEIIEVISLLQRNSPSKRRLGFTPEQIASNIQATKHQSRIRLALDALADNGILQRVGGSYIPKEAVAA